MYEAIYCFLLGGFMFLAPHHAYAFFDAITMTATLTPLGTETFYFRMFGALGPVYIGIFYATASYSELEAFFRASVWTRCVVLPIFHVSIVLMGLTSTAWLEAAIPVDLLLGLHMHYCLKAKAE